MGEVVPVPEGTASDQTYLVSYSEDLWFALPEDRREYCKYVWTLKATSVKGVKYVMLRLLPDELFPSFGNEKPYIMWQDRIERAYEAPFKVELTFDVYLRDQKLTTVYKAEILRQLSVRYGHGFRYAIWQNGAKLAAGKL